MFVYRRCAVINEKEEFDAYTGTVAYTAKDKQDTAYLGRFTFDSILDGVGLARVLTVIARGYLWRPGCDAGYARRALCAWCSIPDSKKAAPKEEWQFQSDFRDLYDEFPELVGSDGAGWFYRHVHGITNFVLSHPDKVSKTAYKKAELIYKGWDRQWRKKVVQYQVPLFSPETKGGWIIRFDDILADALEQGALREEKISLPQELIDRLVSAVPEIHDDVLPTLVRYYIANKPDDTDWVVLPVSNFDAYFGTTSFSRTWLSKIPSKIMERQKQSFGVCRYRIAGEWLV